VSFREKKRVPVFFYSESEREGGESKPIILIDFIFLYKNIETLDW
jgi:hypothetical protein